MPLADLRDLLGPPARYRIECPDAPAYFAELVVGARWRCGCAAHGPRFAELTPAPCAAHVDTVMSARFRTAHGALGAHAS